MTTHTLPTDDNAEVEVCPVCGSAFFEYFDGEPAQLARALRESEPPKGYAAGSHVKAGCPDCGDDYDYMRYLEDGPFLFRCGSCMAVFATADQLHELASFSQLEERGGWLSEFLKGLA